MHTFHNSAPASTYRLLAVSFFCLLCRKNRLMQHNRSCLFIVCSIPPFHIGPSDSSTTNTLDVWWCTPLARISCTDMHDISPVLWSIHLHILHFLHHKKHLHVFCTEFSRTIWHKRTGFRSSGYFNNPLFPTALLHNHITKNIYLSLWYDFYI